MFIYLNACQQVHEAWLIHCASYSMDCIQRNRNLNFIPFFCWNTIWMFSVVQLKHISMKKNFRTRRGLKETVRNKLFLWKCLNFQLKDKISHQRYVISLCISQFSLFKSWSSILLSSLPKIASILPSDLFAVQKTINTPKRKKFLNKNMFVGSLLNQWKLKIQSN